MSQGNATTRQNILNKLSQCFSEDPRKYIVSQLPLKDGMGRYRFIDFAIISRDTSKPRVAILIKPNTLENSNKLPKDLEILVNLLRTQNWTPVLYTADKLKSLSPSIANELKEIAN